MALFDELRARRIELGFAQNVRGLFPKITGGTKGMAHKISLLRLIR
jgi:hypothetical protein